jgi:hypothetical protein
VLRERAPSIPKKRLRLSLLDSYEPYLEQRHAEYALSSIRLLEEIRVMGYTGGIGVVRRFIRSLDLHHSKRRKMTVQFEPPPGEQASERQFSSPWLPLFWPGGIRLENRTVTLITRPDSGIGSKF